MKLQFVNDGIKEWLQSSRHGQQIELVPWEFHHYIDFAAAPMPQESTYFNIAAGQVLSGGSVATQEDCNLFKASSIGYPYKFLVQEMASFVKPLRANNKSVVQQAAEADIANQYAQSYGQVMNAGSVTFETLQKTYVNLSPLAQLPSGIGYAGAVALSASTAAPANTVAAALANGWSVKTNRHNVEIPLDEETQFNVFLKYPKGIITLTIGLTVGFIIAGILQRPKV